DSKRQVKALLAADLKLGGLAFDTSLAAWLLKPGGKSEDLAGQVYSHLGETVAIAEPNQLVPEVEALSPATEAWYVLRLAGKLAERLEPGSRKVLDDIELP